MPPPTTLPHLVLCGWFCPGTGFTRVLDALVPHLLREYRVTWLGVGYKGPRCEPLPGLQVLPTNLRGGDLVGACALRREFSQFSPDVILALNDVWYLVHYSRELCAVLGKVPMVGYLPLDGEISDCKLVSELHGYSALATYTRWAAQNLAWALAEAGIETPVEQVGHGVDLSAFHPLLDMERRDLMAARMELAGSFFDLPEPAFVVLNASRPDPRKRIDLTLDGFARFAQGRPDNIRLCLHQAHGHPQFVEPLRQQAQELGIAERIIWYPPSSEAQATPGPLSDADLNRLYNACAVGVNSAHGEGFGLVSFEHAACGAAQIVPGHPAMHELWGAASLMLPADPVQTAHSPLRMGVVDPVDIAAALTRLHDEPESYRSVAHSCWQRSQQEDLRWDRIGEAMLALLRRVRGAATAIHTR